MRENRTCGSGEGEATASPISPSLARTGAVAVLLAYPRESMLTVLGGSSTNVGSTDSIGKTEANA